MARQSFGQEADQVAKIKGRRPIGSTKSLVKQRTLPIASPTKATR
jgi:hypothetical protein